MKKNDIFQPTSQFFNRFSPNENDYNLDSPFYNGFHFQRITASQTLIILHFDLFRRLRNFLPSLTEKISKSEKFQFSIFFQSSSFSPFHQFQTTTMSGETPVKPVEVDNDVEALESAKELSLKIDLPACLNAGDSLLIPSNYDETINDLKQALSLLPLSRS